MTTAGHRVSLAKSLGLISHRNQYDEIPLTHISTPDSGRSRVTRDERQHRVGTEVSGSDQWDSGRSRKEGAHCQCIQSHEPTIDEVLLGKSEGSRRHASREFQEGNDGPSEGYASNEDAEIGSNKLEM
jgi:hypothetical protein